MAVEGESLTAEGKYPFSTPDFLAALMRGMQRFERARGAGFNATSRLADMDEHGVDVQVLYPTVGGQLLGREFHDAELLAACCRAYNDVDGGVLPAPRRSACAGRRCCRCRT